MQLYIEIHWNMNLSNVNGKCPLGFETQPWCTSRPVFWLFRGLTCPFIPPEHTDGIALSLFPLTYPFITYTSHSPVERFGEWGLHACASAVWSLCSAALFMSRQMENEDSVRTDKKQTVNILVQCKSLVCSQYDNVDVCVEVYVVLNQTRGQ